MKMVTDALLADGVQKFSEAFDQLLSAVEKKRQALLVGRVGPTAPEGNATVTEAGKAKGAA
jgi:hypothetical protein